MTCIRDKKGRFQKHNFGQETENEQGFVKSCYNCGLQLFQSHAERRLKRHLNKFYASCLLRSTVKLLKVSQIFKKNGNAGGTKFRRYGEIAREKANTQNQKQLQPQER